MVKDHEIPDDQGALFGVEFHGNGSADPGNYQVRAELTPTPEGSFQEAPKPDEPVLSPTITSALRQEAARRRHSLAQTGSHSPLQRSESYLDVRPGDVLPGFGVVTNRRLAAATRHAQNLEAERRRR